MPLPRPKTPEGHSPLLIGLLIVVALYLGVRFGLRIFETPVAAAFGVGFFGITAIGLWQGAAWGRVMGQLMCGVLALGALLLLLVLPRGTTQLPELARGRPLWITLTLAGLLLVVSLAGVLYLRSRRGRR